MYQYPIYLIKFTFLILLIIYFSNKRIRNYYKIRIKLLPIYLISSFLILFSLINYGEYSFLRRDNNHSDLKNIKIQEYNLNSSVSEDNLKFYFGKWTYIVDDTVYREFWLNDSLLVLPVEDSLQVYEQDVIDNIIFFTEKKNGENLRIFFAKPLYINDSTIILDGDEFTAMSDTAKRIDRYLPKNIIEFEKDLIDGFRKRKKEAQQ